MAAVSKKAKVGVVILNYNGKEFLRKCLTSLESQSYDELVAIVVDNGSTDGSHELVRNRFPSVTLVEMTRNTGVGATNEGIRKALEAGCDFIFLTDNDTLFDRETIAILVAAMVSDSGIGIAAPMQIALPSMKTSALGGYIQWTTFRIRRPTKLEGLTQVDYAGASLVRRGVIERVGYIDGRFIASWQDVDFGVRATRAGFRVCVVPDAKLFHYGNQTISTIRGLGGFVRLRNRLILAKRHIPAWRLPMVALINLCDLPIQMGLWLFGGRRIEALTTVLGFLDGLYFLLLGRESESLLRLGQQLMNGSVHVPVN